MVLEKKYYTWTDRIKFPKACREIFSYAPQLFGLAKYVVTSWKCGCLNSKVRWWSMQTANFQRQIQCVRSYIKYLAEGFVCQLRLVSVTDYKKMHLTVFNVVTQDFMVPFTNSPRIMDLSAWMSSALPSFALPVGYCVLFLYSIIVKKCWRALSSCKEVQHLGKASWSRNASVEFSIYF